MKELRIAITFKTDGASCGGGENWAQKHHIVPPGEKDFEGWCTSIFIPAHGLKIRRWRTRHEPILGLSSEGGHGSRQQRGSNQEGPLAVKEKREGKDAGGKHAVGTSRSVTTIARQTWYTQPL